MTLLDLRDGMDPVVELTRRLIETVDRPDADKPWGLYFLSGDSDFAPLARFVERQVFMGWFGNDDHVMDAEYGPFEPASVFSLTVDHRNAEPIGVSRVIEPTELGLKTVIDIENEERWGRSFEDIVATHRPARGPAGVYDVATLAVRRDAEHAPPLLVAGSLYHSLYQYSQAAPVDFFIAAIDEVVAGHFAANGMMLVPVCDLPAIEYLGSPATRPYLIPIREMVEDIHSGGPAALFFGRATYTESFSLPPLDLRDDPPHPAEAEPQFIDPAKRAVRPRRGAGEHAPQQAPAQSVPPR